MTNFQVKKTFFKQAVRVGVIVLMFHFQLEAQTTIWSEDFSNCANGTAVESGGCGWATYAITASAHNYFGVTNDVAYRINANNNLTVYGDPAGAAAVYSYDKYQATNEVAYYATKINASAYSALKLNFKWKCVGEGTTSDDHGAVCYSADGTTWTDLTSSLYNQNTTQTVTNLSISTLDLTQFYIGVRWVCDNDVDGMPPIIIDDMSITTIEEAQEVFHSLSANGATSAHLLFAHPEVRPDVSRRGLPILSSEPFTVLTHAQLNDRWEFSTVASHLSTKPTYDLIDSGAVLNVVTRVMRLTRGKLLKQQDWEDWQASEFLQLDQYDAQGMFGSPVIVDICY
ncbi:MAG: hypothetical protein RL711_1034 [Bacteroidota bacterium]